MKSAYFISLIFLTCCSGIKTKVITRPGFTFDKLESFCWIDGCEDRYSGPLYAIDKEKMLTLKKILHEELTDAGWRRDFNAPDILIGFRVYVTEQNTTRGSSEDHLENGYRHETEGAFFPYEQESNYKFLKGSLIIDLIDSKSGNTAGFISLSGYMELKEQISEDALRTSLHKAFRKAGLVKG